MLHNRYNEEYESDFQYYLRREINNTVPSYKAVYLTPSGEWYYDEPVGDYIIISVLSKSTQANIDIVCKQHMNLFCNPF